jgi:DNA repair protein RadC
MNCLNITNKDYKILINKYKTLDRIVHAKENDLLELVSESTACKVLNAKLLIQKVLESRITEKQITLSSPDTVAHYLQQMIGYSDRENFCVIYLDIRNNLISSEVLFSGDINKSVVHVRYLCRKALLNNAVSVILSHNHPSGKVDPSISDIDITKHVKKSLKLIDIEVLDHIIVSEKNYYSFREKRLSPWN